MSIRQITVNYGPAATDAKGEKTWNRRPGIEDIRLSAYSRTRERERQRESIKQRMRHYYEKDTPERDRGTQVYRDREGYTEGWENEEGT